MRRRAGEKIFGVLPILVVWGVIVAVASGVELPRLVSAVPAMIVIGWAVVHHIVVRPYGVERPEDSPPHDPG